jgi:hypothetical protein
MAYKPNYGLQRADRNRAARTRSEQKQQRERKNLLNAKPNAQLRLKAHLTMIRHNEERSMNAAESKGLKRGSRVNWRGDATDGGISPK